MTLRLLWGSPLQPTRSGVADYAAELLPELTRLARVRVLVPPGHQLAPGVQPSGFELVPATTPPDRDELQLLHLGNNPYHEWLLERLRLPRTVVVTHDLVLHHLLVESTLGHGDRVAYERQLVIAHGPAGEALAVARRYGLTGRLDPFLFASRRPFLDGALAVVVHSEWARQLVERDVPGVAVRRVGLAVADPGPVDRAAERLRLGLGEADVLLMHVGFLTPEKGLTHILPGLAAANRAGVPARLVLVGEGRVAGALREVVEALDLRHLVTTTGWVEDDMLRRLPAAADLGVVLRTPSAGETSSAAVRFLACGTPVAVGGSGQFLEWPEAAAPRLTPGPSAAAELARLLARVASERDQPVWQKRREAARRAYEQDHRPADVARALVAALEGL